MAEDDAAERPYKEANGVRRECRGDSREPVGLREEQRAEDERRCRRIDVEVVPLDRGANERGDAGSSGPCMIEGRRSRDI
jgi:hypothetical protein